MNERNNPAITFSPLPRHQGEEIAVYTKVTRGGPPGRLFVCDSSGKVLGKYGPAQQVSNRISASLHSGDKARSVGFRITRSPGSSSNFIGFS